MARRQQDLELRSEYAASVWSCELHRLLIEAGVTLDWGAYRGGKQPASSRKAPIDNLEVNHIWSNRQRPDLWSNLIVVSDAAHRWFHENATLGRVPCLYAKWRKGCPDWNPEELRHASGQYPLGWLENQKLSGVFAVWQRQILEHPGGFPSGGLDNRDDNIKM